MTTKHSKNCGFHYDRKNFPEPCACDVRQKNAENAVRDYWTIEAMLKYGGSFVKALAEVARYADPQNLAKIKATWVEYWAEYEKMGREMEQNNKQ